MDRPYAYWAQQKQQQETFAPPSQENTAAVSTASAAPLKLQGLRNSREFEPTIAVKARVMVNTVIDDFRSLFATAAHRNLPHRQCKYNGHVMPSAKYHGSKLHCVECGAEITSAQDLREIDGTSAMYKNRTAGTAPLVDYWVDEATKQDRRDSRNHRRMR